MAGREGLVDTAVKTAETGYMQVTASGAGLLSVLQKEDVSYVGIEVRGGERSTYIMRVFVFNLTESNLYCEICDFAPFFSRREVCKTDLGQRYSNVLLLSCFLLNMGDKSPCSVELVRTTFHVECVPKTHVNDRIFVWTP